MASSPGPKVLVLTGLGMFSGGSDDPMTGTLLEVIKRTGLQLDECPFPPNQGATAAQRLAQGGYQACYVYGLGSGSDFVPRNPTKPFVDGPWRTRLTAWVEAGGVLVVHGERAAAHVMRLWFGKTWKMENDYYRRTDFALNPAHPLLSGCPSLPSQYNVKACMLEDVPPHERVYATQQGAVVHSHVFGPDPVAEGKCPVALGAYGQGKVIFFGDVNAEQETVHIVINLLVYLLGGRLAPPSSAQPEPAAAQQARARGQQSLAAAAAAQLGLSAPAAAQLAAAMAQLDPASSGLQPAQAVAAAAEVALAAVQRGSEAQQREAERRQKRNAAKRAAAKRKKNAAAAAGVGGGSGAAGDAGSGAEGQERGEGGGGVGGGEEGAGGKVAPGKAEVVYGAEVKQEEGREDGKEEEDEEGEEELELPPPERRYSWELNMQINAP